jgi:transcriptional regulator with XRE-family HTH domain
MKGYDIGKRLKEIRKERKLSLSEVSSNTGVGVSYISMLENNKRRVNMEILERLAACYRVRLHEFFQRPRRRTTKSLEAHLRGLSQNKRRQAIRTLQGAFADNPEALALLKKLT